LPITLGLTWWPAVRELRQSAPSPIYILERAPRQLARIHRLLRLSRIDPARCVFAADERSYEDEHWIDLYTRVALRTPPVLSGADYPIPHGMRKATPRLVVLQSERDTMEAWLREQGWSGERLVLIQPGNFRTMSRRRARWERADDKAWPIDHWVWLLQRISSGTSEQRIVLCGSPQETGMLHRIKTASGLPSVLIAGIALRSLFALCALAETMISIDTGPAHAAAAVGLPVVVMYGAQSPSRWLPRSPTGSAVIGLGGPPSSTRVDQIPTHDVFNAWSSLTTRVAQVPAEPVFCPIR